MKLSGICSLASGASLCGFGRVAEAEIELLYLHQLNLHDAKPDITARVQDSGLPHTWHQVIVCLQVMARTRKPKPMGACIEASPESLQIERRIGLLRRSIAHVEQEERQGMHTAILLPLLAR